MHIPNERQIEYKKDKEEENKQVATVPKKEQVSLFLKIEPYVKESEK